MNERYRRPLGLPDLTWDVRLAKAAQAHSRYLTLNDTAAASFHNETPGKAGFSGAGPWQRCLAVGAGGCGEVGAAGADLAAAVPAWLELPYHALPFFQYGNFGCALAAPAVCNMNGATDFGGQNPDFAAPVNTPGSPVRIWPFDGATGVPTRFAHTSDFPDPLGDYTGNRGIVGAPLFVGASEEVTATLRQADGTVVPLLEPNATSASANPELDNEAAEEGLPPQLAWHALLPARELRKNASYTLTVTDEDGRSWSTRFTTLAAPAGIDLLVNEQRRTITVALPAGPARVTVTVRRKDGTRLVSASVKPNTAWAWAGFRRGGSFVVCANSPAAGERAAGRKCRTVTFGARP